MRSPVPPLVLATVVLLLTAPVAGATVATGPQAAAGPVGADDASSVQQSQVTLTVAVTDSNGDPVSNAELTATWSDGSATATTASNGRAFLDVPEGADVELTLDHPKYVRNSPYTVENADERTVDLTARRKGSLTVRVEDSAGDPIQGARVVLRSDGKVVATGQTNAQGGFSTGVIEQRQYGLTVVQEGYYRVHRDVRVGDETTEDVALERGSVTVSFEVTDDHFDPPEPVSEARLDLESVGTFTTLRNGEATAQVPVNADLDLQVTKEGYETVTRTLSVGEKPTTVSLDISRTDGLNVTAANERVLVGERTTVSVVDEYGQPVADARILLDGEQVGTTGGDGTLRVRVESAGDHTVVAETDELTSAELTIEGVRERTATRTATETASPTMTATETESPTATEAQSGVRFPGFGPVTVVAAVLVLAGLLALRSGRGDE